MLKSTAAKALAGLVAAILLVAAGFFAGHHYGALAPTVKCQATQIVQQAAVIKHDDKVAAAAATQASDAQATGVQVQQQTEKVHETTHQFIVKVPVYIPAAANAGCSINAGFVRLWNDANTGSAGPVPADSGGGQQPATEGEGAGSLSTAKPFSLPAESGGDAGPAK